MGLPQLFKSLISQIIRNEHHKLICHLLFDMSIIFLGISSVLMTNAIIRHNATYYILQLIACAIIPPSSPFPPVSCVQVMGVCQVWSLTRGGSECQV